MDIKGEQYHIAYNPETATIACEGDLQLYGAEGYFSISAYEKRHADPTTQKQDGTEGYATIMKLFHDVVDKNPFMITLDMRKLQTLNSSGINTFSKFVMRVEASPVSQLTIRCNRQFPWQEKILRNLKRLLPDMLVEWG